MAKIKDLPPSTLFIHNGLIHMRLADDFPANAVKMPTGELIRFAGEKIDEANVIATWNELHAKLIELHGAK